MSNRRPKNPSIDADGTKRWHDSLGRYHRTDGPAIIYPDGERVWYMHGRVHRTDGPAVTYKDSREEWYVDGKKVEPIPDFILKLMKRLNTDARTQ